MCTKNYVHVLLLHRVLYAILYLNDKHLSACTIPPAWLFIYYCMALITVVYITEPLAITTKLGCMCSKKHERACAAPFLLMKHALRDLAACSIGRPQNFSSWLAQHTEIS